MRGWDLDWKISITLTGICNQIDRFTPRLSDMIGTIYRLKYLWSIKLMFCESKSGSQRDPDLTFRVESVSHSNCVAIQKDHVIFGDLSATSNSHWVWQIAKHHLSSPILYDTPKTSNLLVLHMVERPSHPRPARRPIGRRRDLHGPHGGGGAGSLS